MSHFLYKCQPSRRKRKGIWLRHKFNSNPDVKNKIKESNLLRPTEMIWRIEVKDLLPENKVGLEVWANDLKDRKHGQLRNTVIWIVIEENPEWVCEGDLGRGLPGQ